MVFKLYSDVKPFYQDVYDVLMRHEAQNLVPLGNVIMGNEGGDKAGWRDPVNWFMAAVSDGMGVRLTAVMTPPYHLTLYATDNQFDGDVLALLVEGIIGTGFSIHGVMTENVLAEGFAKTYAAAKGIKHRIHKSQRIYELSRVNPNIPSVGALRLAQESDMAFLPYWDAGFHTDCFGSAPPIQDHAGDSRLAISSGKLYILEDRGTPVSMAKMSREMRTVCGVGNVYTPPYFRGRGYASSCVAAISRLILERGFAKCVLYTDLANLISNGIYQRIGYKPVCDSLDIVFE